MSREQIGISVPKCDNCGVLRQGGYGQMMGWPHSGWVTVTLSDPLRTYDFHSVGCARAWLNSTHVAGCARAWLNSTHVAGQEGVA